MKGVHYHGTVTPERIAREKMSSELYLYPNTFEETQCVNVAENIAAWLPTITSNSGALPETIRDTGILINGNPYSQEYQEAFIAATVDMLTNEKLRMKYMSQCSKYDLDWKEAIPLWENLINIKKEV
jgi:glycosyltransferase involved in cell wall biosynthesis